MPYVKEEAAEEVVTLLEVEDLRKSYGKKVVIDDLSFSIDRGECYALIGRNGIGKSTTIDCIVGLKEKDSGHCRIYGFDQDKDPLSYKANFGYCSSEPVAYECMTGKEYLTFIASAYGMIKGAFDENYEALKQSFNFPEEDITRRIGEYSHGMKQKICLMGSLIHNPDVWILDEPTVGLDIMVYQILVKTAKAFLQNGKAILLTSHSIEFINEISTKVAILDDGGIARNLNIKENPYLKKDLYHIFFELYEDKKG